MSLQLPSLDSFLKNLRQPSVVLKVLTTVLFAYFSAEVSQSHFGDVNIDEAFVGVRFLGVLAAVLSGLDALFQLSIPEGDALREGLIGKFVDVADVLTVGVATVVVHAITLSSDMDTGENMAAMAGLLAISLEVATNDSRGDSYRLGQALSRVPERLMAPAMLARLANLGLLLGLWGSLNGAAVTDSVPEAGSVASEFVCKDSDGGAVNSLQSALGAETLTLVVIGSEALDLIFNLNSEVEGGKTKFNPLLHYISIAASLTIVHTSLVCSGDGLNLFSTHTELALLECLSLLLLMVRRPFGLEDKADGICIGDKFPRFRAVDNRV